LSHDVTFVGQLYGERGAVIDRLAQSGIHVETWGTGWGVRRWHRAAAKAPVVRSVGGRRILSRAQERTRADQQQMIEIFGTSRVNINLTDSSQAGEAQIKGRTFEVPACGGFLLTGWAQELEAYFEPGREVAVFRDTDELVDKSRFYLDHEESRRQIALAGYQRTVAEHTYERRLSELIRSMGLTGRVSR
jgi:spore maturation protein CgeB